MLRITDAATEAVVLHSGWLASNTEDIARTKKSQETSSQVSNKETEERIHFM